MPFYVWIPLSITFAYFGSIVLTELLARTPLAMPVAGRKQIPWRAPRQAGSRQADPRQGGTRRAGSHRKVASAAVPADAIQALSAPVGAAAAPPPAAPGLTPAPAPAPAARDRESTTLAATACDQNGA
jgi:hypothetical protein